MLKSLACASLIVAMGLYSPSHAACSWTTITNGTTANADQVMNNFDCLAPLTSPTFTGKIYFPWAPLSANADGIVWYSPNPLSYGIYKTPGVWDPPNYQQLMVSFATGVVIDGGTAYGKSGTTIQPNGGKVGIGTASPTTTLQVDAPAASFLVQSTTGNNRAFSVAANGASSILTGVASSLGGGSLFTGDLAYAAVVGNQYNYPLQFATNSIVRVTLNASGDLGVGTASPAQKLDVAGTIRQSGCTTATTLSASSSGDIICTPSDARLKDIYGHYSGGLREINRIKPVRFRYKTTSDNPARGFEHAGFIAQELEHIIPQSVARQKNGYYTIDTTAILAAAVNAIKELEAKNAEQARQIVQLSRRLRTVEAASGVGAVRKGSGNGE